jgi:hypothetical protein
MVGLNWFWIGVQLIVPTIAGLLVAWPLWRTDQPVFGNLAASIVLFGSAFALIMREHVEIDRAVGRCLGQGFTCWPDPSAFTRLAIYACIGMSQVIAVFALSLRVEAKRRRRGYDPQWR